MFILSIIFFVLAVGIFALANYKFIKSSRYVNYDRAFASLKFDQPFIISNLFLCSGLALIKVLVWYYALLLFVILLFIGNLYKWQLLDKIVRRYRINY
jgi:hypothetical protein